MQLQCQTFADNVSQVALICFANNFVNISSANCSFDGGPPLPCKYSSDTTMSYLYVILVKLMFVAAKDGYLNHKLNFVTAAT